MNKLSNILLADDGKIFEILTDGSFLFSDDEGKTFKKVSSDFDASKVIRFQKNSLGHLYIQVLDNISVKLLISKDNGVSWQLLKDLGSSGFYNIGKNDEIITCDISKNTVMYSNDYGNTWTTKTCSLLQNNSLNLRNAAISGNYIFISTYYDGIIKSSDGGNTWAFNNTGLNSYLKGGKQIKVFNINEVFGKVYASSDIGLFASNLADTTWTLQESGMPPSYSRFTKYLKDKHIYTTTYLGVFRSVDEITSVENETLVINGININVQPNPISQEGTINISSVNTSNLKLSLYDVTGNIIKVIYNNSISSGNISLSLNAADLLPGQYFLRAETDKYSKSKIISIIK